MTPCTNPSSPFFFNRLPSSSICMHLRASTSAPMKAFCYLAGVLLLLLQLAAGATTVDGLALWEIADSLTGIPVSWRKGTDPCSPAWEDVLCDNAGQVYSIVLPVGSASGTLPATSFTSLSSLQYLHLMGNSITGRLPSIAGLSRLEEAYFNGNNFTSVPSSFLGTGLPNLSSLDLGDNPLAPWSIPGRLANCIALATLAADNANQAGSVPDFIGHLSGIQTVTLSGNNLTGTIPESLASLPKLQLLDLSRNNLWGRVPSFKRGVEVKTGENPSIGKSPPPPPAASQPSPPTPAR